MENLNNKDAIIDLLSKNIWPFKEAQNLLKRINYQVPEKGYILFETGYGPSGLPHIGTFGEVVRTNMIRMAFQFLSDIPTKLKCFSDDMDGMRKIPDTIPNKSDYINYMDLPLTKIPDPFGTHRSFGDNMNSRLCGFLDSFGFDYEFQSATDCYSKGVFNDKLKLALEKYEEIMDVMLPTLGEERRKTYSIFLPVCPKTGRVLQVPIIDKDIENGIIAYRDPEEGNIVHTKVTDGHCKLQWKPDFGMRWAAFDVDFEMYGKDHLVNGPIYTKICKILNGKGPQQMFYELFLDENGQKISKSKGNGLTIEEWLRYAPEESLSLFMYSSPQKAKKLYFDVIPKNVDEYLMLLTQYNKETDQSKKMSNPVFFIHKGSPPEINIDFSYSLLLNLVSACNTDNPKIIWEYLENYKGSKVSFNSLTDKMIEGAVNYYNDFVKASKVYRAPNEQERKALLDLEKELKQLDESEKYNPEVIQNKVYEVGKRNEMELKSWFKGLYEMLLGASQGPRFGSFVALYGIEETIHLINNSLSK